MENIKTAKEVIDNKMIASFVLGAITGFAVGLAICEVIFH